VATDVETVAKLGLGSGATMCSVGVTTTAMVTKVKVRITTSSTAGNLQLQAAQNTSGGNTVNIKAGTQMTGWKIG
jgi:hypothetical protein